VIKTIGSAILVSLGLFISLSLSAQQVSDLNDRLYMDLTFWREQGLIGDLPPL
jgi:hypothetical protein